jgi:hypothetical protein
MGQCPCLPEGSVPATVEIMAGLCRLTGWALDSDDARATHTLREHYHLSLHHAIHNMRTDHQYVQCLEENIITQIRTGGIRLVSDESYLRGPIFYGSMDHIYQ